MRRSDPRHWFARREAFDEILDVHHLTSKMFASEIGLSRQHWSTVLNARQPASRRLRMRIARHPAFGGVKADRLWRVEETGRQPIGDGGRAA